jgi:hypothetical protein
LPHLSGGRAVDEGTFSFQDTDGTLDGVDLDGRVDDQSEVGNADANDLNGILLTKSIPYNHTLVQEGENEERQKRRNRSVLRLYPLGDVAVSNTALETGLEPAENVAMMIG